MGDGVPWLRRAILRASWQWARSRDDNDVGYLFGHGGSARAWLSLSLSPRTEVHCEASDVPKNGTRRERRKREIGGVD